MRERGRAGSGNFAFFVRRDSRPLASFSFTFGVDYIVAVLGRASDSELQIRIRIPRTYTHVRPGSASQRCLGFAYRKAPRQSRNPLTRMPFADDVGSFRRDGLWQ